MANLQTLPVVLLFAVLFIVLHNQWYAYSGITDDEVRRQLSPSKIVQDFWSSKKEKFGLKGSTKTNAEAKVANKVTLAYVVGVEGSGYNEVAAVLATVAKTCQQHVIMRNPILRASRMYTRAPAFGSVLNSTKSTPYSQREVILFDEQSFPAEGIMWNSTTAEKRQQGKYNIDWVYQQVALDPNITMKILYVSRDLYQTAASITTQPHQFRSRVDVSREFASYLKKEYKLHAKKADIWAQVAYEDVLRASNCTAMVSGLVEFMQFTECDVEHACNIIRDTLKPQAIIDIDVENYAYTLKPPDTAEKHDKSRGNTLQLPIPLIDINDNKTYSFTTYISDRKSFSYIPTPVSKTMSPKQRAAMFSAKLLEDRSVNFTTKAINTLSYVFVVGVEGVGHHGVTPVIASIAQTCNYHVVYENSVLRTACRHNTPNRYQSMLNAFMRLKIPHTNKLLVIEGQSFPTDVTGRHSTPAQKKNTTVYNLEWVYKHTKAVGANPKFIHLTRDFYRTVASHPEFDNGFEPHADVLHAFLMHINAEYQAINQQAPNLWTEVNYESFTHMQNCTALVSAIVNFMQWDECDVEFACEIIKSTVKMGRNRTVNAEDYAYAQRFNTTLPIPKLDITPTNVYNFRTVVSDRKAFSFIHNATNRNRQAFIHPYKSLSGIGSSIKRNVSSVRAPFTMASHHTRASNNNVSFVYVVGVEGSGNTDVSRTLTQVAQACGYYVLYKHKALWRAQSKQLPRTYVATLESIAHSLYQHTNKVRNFRMFDKCCLFVLSSVLHHLILITTSYLFVFSSTARQLLILEDAPFAGGTSSGSATAKNNLIWVHDRLVEYKQAYSRFLYIQRPIEDIMIHVDGKESSMEARSQKLQDHISVIYEEYKRIAEKGGVWGQADYDWFVQSVGNNNTSSSASFGNKDSSDSKRDEAGVRCVALVTALIKFVGWGECDIADACSRIEALHFTETNVIPGNVKKIDATTEPSITTPIPSIPYKLSNARN